MIRQLLRKVRVVLVVSLCARGLQGQGQGIFLDNQGCPERECSALLWGGLGIDR